MPDQSTAGAPSSAPQKPRARTRVQREVACDQCCDPVFAQRRPGQHFCSGECYHEWWTEHRQHELSTKGTERLVQLVRDGSEARARVRAKIADRDRRVAEQPAGATLPPLRIQPIRLPEVPGDGLGDDTARAVRGRYGRASTTTGAVGGDRRLPCLARIVPRWS